jgi:hypothetical protein
MFAYGLLPRSNWATARRGLIKERENMVLEYLDFYIAALLVSIGTACLGIFFCGYAWIQVLFDSGRPERGQMFAAVWAFTGGSFLESVGFVAVTSIPYGVQGYGPANDKVPFLIWTMFFPTAVILLVVSRILIRRNAGPARGTVMAGSMVLIVLHLLGAIMYVGLHILMGMKSLGG